MPALTFDLINDLARIDPETGELDPKRDAIEQGADFAWTVQYQAADVEGTAAEDWSARMQIRRAYADRDTGAPLVDLDSETLGGLTISVVDDPEGDLVNIAIHIEDAVTAGMPIGRWFYDIKLIRVEDDYARWPVKGRVQVTPRVTR